MKRLDEGLIRDLVLLKLSMVSIEARNTTKMPAELSGGMVKRVALARALSRSSPSYCFSTNRPPVSTRTGATVS